MAEGIATPALTASDARAAQEVLLEQERMLRYEHFGSTEALKLGNSRVFNNIVLGLAARHMDFTREEWLKVIAEKVPPKTVEINTKAFLAGYEQ